MVVLPLVVLLTNIALSRSIFFEAGYDHHYTYSADSNIFGMYNVTTVIKFRIRAVNETENGESLNLLLVDSLVHHTGLGYVSDNSFWNSNHTFFFKVGRNGLVTLVYFHQAEKYEVLNIKKALASTLSLRVQVEEGRHWSFTSYEEDHTGHLEHQYEASRSTNGLTFVRHHQSSENIHRLHNKTTHLDLNGTPTHIHVLDNVTLTHSQSKISSNTPEGFEDIEEEQSGEFPNITSISTSTMKMILKSKHNELSSHSITDLNNDTLTVKRKPPEKIPLNESVEIEIQKHLTKLHSLSNKYDRNGTESVHKLRALIYSLKTEDFIKFGTKVLTTECEEDDVVCVDERNIFIHIIAQEGSADAQLLILDLIMRKPNVTEEDLRRCLFQVITLKEPAPEFVEHVEGLCFQQDVEPGDTPVMTKTRKRACLALGSIAKSLHNTNLTESDRIVERIHSWLDYHNESKSRNILKRRERRSIIQHDLPSRKHIETKMVLIQSLGNAGKQASLGHIRSYMEPNVGVTAWRRAAIRSLRQFTCNESSHALLTSAVHDDDDMVRQAAIDVLKNHPRMKTFTVEHENIVLSKNYSYPVVSRVRRGIDFVVSWNKVFIDLSPIDWKKEVGGENIGASFGIVIRNTLDLELGLLSGHFKVDVLDELYAEAHAKMFGEKQQVDIIRCSVCFRGHISYNLNVLKDFGIHRLEDLVHLYDKILDKVISPLVNAVNNFRKTVLIFKERGMSGIINALIQTVKSLPTILGDVGQRMQSFFEKVYSFSGSSELEEIKILIQNAKNVFSTVQQNVLTFYNDIVDEVLIGLPYVAKNIIEGFNLLVNSLGQLPTNPLQGIAAMSRAYANIHMAVTMAVDLKKNVADTCMFDKGRTHEWLNMAKEIPNMTKRLRDVFNKLTNPASRRKPSHQLDLGMSSAYSDGVLDMKDSVLGVQRDLVAQSQDVLKRLGPLAHTVQPFVDQFKSIMDLIKGIKWEMKAVKEAVEKSKSLVQKVFGPKFHPKFPTMRRRALRNCKEGVWPTTTYDEYTTTGVDLALGKGQSIVMPVNGILHTAYGNRVRIEPTDPEFSHLEIIIENIKPRGNGGNFVKAGEKIGKASKAPRCQPNFIHMSVRIAQKTIVSDKDYDYTDPTIFLDRLVPIPKWIQDCNHFEFRFLGNTIDTGETADKKQHTKEPIERDTTNLNELESLLAEKEPFYRPDDPELYDEKSFKDSIMKSLNDAVKQFAGIFKMTSLGKGGGKVPNVLDIIDMSGKSVKWIRDKLVNGKLKSKFEDLIDRLGHAMTDLPFGDLATMSLPLMKNLIKNKGHSTSHKGGDVSYLRNDLSSLAAKECPNFKDSIPEGYGHFCIANDCCLGFTCSVEVTKGAATKYIKLRVDIDPGYERLTIEVKGETWQFNWKDEEEEIDLDQKIFGMNIYLATNTKRVGGVLYLSAELKRCSPVYLTCLPPIDIFREIKFNLNNNCRKKKSTVTSFMAAKEELLRSKVPRFMSQLGEYLLLTKESTNVLDGVRETVLRMLMSGSADTIGDVVKETKDIEDFCLSGNIPIFNDYLTLFEVSPSIPLGPIFVTVGLGAGAGVGMGFKVGFCLLSMTAKMTVTPFVGAKVWAHFGVDVLGVLHAGIKLVGYFLETKFPTTAELEFSKYPINVGLKMDLEFRPLRLQLVLFADMFTYWKVLSLTEEIIWEYSLPIIIKNLFNKVKRPKDPSPPVVLPAIINERRKRSGIGGCIVKQIVGRPYYDPAFSLEMHAEDEVSEVELFYAIGTHRGGTDLVNWTEMGGYRLMIPVQFPGGIPIYWSVKASNSQGLEVISQCLLDTYDSTLPDGRVEHPYQFSSHPNKLIASVIVFDDSQLVDSHRKAIGYNPGQFGCQFLDWETLDLDHAVTRTASGALKQFAIPRRGKLVASILESPKASTPDKCAQWCIDYGSNCVSFDFDDYHDTCDLHEFVQGANAYLRISGAYSNYERLGIGHHAPLEYSGLQLTHGSTYFVNARVRNVLGYDAFLVGEGTMIDFTPPEPGVIKNARQDILRADRCNAAITQRCTDVTWKDNHRIIIDGPGSGTIFNGHAPSYEELYTITNHFVTANWKGFYDDESGIWGYTWAVGRNICDKDVIPFTNPYLHLSDKEFWTDSAFQKVDYLEDGPYYVTVQALNGAELGGSLVTTVCHSTPFTVDTAPPEFYRVTDIIYDEDFDLIAIYYNATDDLSNIVHAEFGLGKTKYDVQLKRYSLHASMERDDPFVAIKELGLQEGIPAWVRIRVTDSVDLYTSGHSKEPILIDKSPPIPGHVLDGDRLRKDRQYQAEDDKICAQWVDFFDPQSGLERFLWGVGTSAGIDNVVDFHNLTRYEKSSCVPVSLMHNQTYYSTVFAYNTALNSKSSNSSSDGVLVDITPPIAGHVNDGETNINELEFSSETVSKYANWDGYYDPESGIDHYKVDVLINNEHKGTFNTGANTAFYDHTISMEHQDIVEYVVHGVNGADLENDSSSNGFFVDLTSPILKAISDNDKNSEYQSDNSQMSLMYEFVDAESGIEEYRIIIYERKFGIKQKFWPMSNNYNVSLPSSPIDTKVTSVLTGLSLKDGATYSLHVTAFNRALLSSSHESGGITIDTTPPPPPKVHIGFQKEEEELDDEGNVLHHGQHGIRVSWFGSDSESGIVDYLIAIGTESDKESVTKYTSFGIECIAYIQNIYFKTTDESGIKYKVYIVALNGAGLRSREGMSKPIYVQQANVPGIVFDGSILFEDNIYTTDHTSIAASFYGFESERCSIIYYDWSIGTTEYGTDIQTYTTYGLALLNETHGKCQMHIELIEDETYYITIRAITACQDEYILSSSDGITLDRIPPEVLFDTDETNDTSTALVNNVIYQGSTDTLPVVCNVTDKNSVATVQWALGSLPLLDNRHPYTDDYSNMTNVVKLIPGEAIFITTNTSDKAGNNNLTSSLAIIADMNAPFVKNLACTKYISTHKSILTCTWDTFEEYESIVRKVEISVGSNSSIANVLDKCEIHKKVRHFTRDLIDPLKRMSNVTKLIVSVNVTNVVGHFKTYGREIIVDRTFPEIDDLIAVTNVDKQILTEHQKCQLPRTFVELRLKGVSDRESGMNRERYQVSIGYKPYGVEIVNYTSIRPSSDGLFFVDGFNLPDETIFYATLRIYNNAGLKTEIASEGVVISQSPILSVIDGNQKDDIDYQSSLSLIQGRWTYSDKCIIKRAYWSVSDMIGNILFDFQEIPSASTVFYNDEVGLENGMKYFVTVKTIDFLGRTKTALSDGVSVRMQVPLPGLVRDGTREDINYQSSTSELSCNWDEFGDGTSDPTQLIKHYEIAIGNDKRYSKTRSNVHFFINVGLNTSYTFTNLNLTSQSVTYYITVRSYSTAGSYIEGYSNGIKVGFNNDISPGELYVKPFQSSLTSVEASWSGFRSDFDIISYFIGISSRDDVVISDTVECIDFVVNSSKYDVYQLRNIGFNEYIKLDNLTLRHKDGFYVTVVAKDDAGMCVSITTDKICVDTTPPNKGTILVNDLRSNTVMYAESTSKILVKWVDVLDLESGIKTVEVSLYECRYCDVDVEEDADCFIIADTVVENDNKTAFYEINLEPERVYYVALDITNRADLSTRVQSASILIDSSTPQVGEVKIAKDWISMDTFQYSNVSLNGLIAIATTIYDYVCPTHKQLFPSSNDLDQVYRLSNDFSTEYVLVNRSGAFLGIGYNTDLTEMIKSSMTTRNIGLQNGNYSFTIRVANGENIVTTFALLTDHKVIPFTVEDKPVEDGFDPIVFENITGIDVSERNDSDLSYTATTKPPTTTLKTEYFVTSNNIDTTIETNIGYEDYGFGIHFLGYRIASNKRWHHIFWARSKYTIIQTWFSLPFDPTTEDHLYTIIVQKKSEYLETTLNIKLIVDENEMINIDNFKFYGEIKIAAFTWNEHGYKPPIDDIYRPFYNDAIIRNILVPDENDKLCRHGRGFYDEESGIKEIWLGVSDSKLEFGNILPWFLYKSFCYPCKRPCEELCTKPCSDDILSDGFNLIPLNVTGLQMETPNLNDICHNVTNNIKCNSTTYYLNTKVVNFAGLETLAYSNGIQVDLTPPMCEYVKCLDPDYSKNAPIKYLGSSSHIGAYWNCSEDMGQIQYYTMCIFDSSSKEIVMNETNIGLKSKTALTLPEGTFVDRRNYTVEITALNTAGLSTKENCIVHVRLFPPNTSLVSIKPLYVDGFNDQQKVAISEEDTPYWTTSQTEMGIEWHDENSETEIYEWKIGTTKDGSDIFPQVKVGETKSGSSAIVHGKLEFNRKPLNLTMAKFREINVPSDESQNRTVSDKRDKNFFFMEPGRCVHQSLYAVGYSHLKSKIQGQTVCVKRNEDVYLNATLESVVASKSKIRDEWSTTDVSDPDIVVDAIIISGGLSLGSLTETDLTSEYGSAASLDYKPYIASPDTTFMQTSRSLRNRIQKFCNMTFFLSPAPIAEYERISFNITVPKGCEKDPNYQPALIYWNSDLEQWFHIDEGCRDYLTAVMDSSIYISEICKENDRANRLTRRESTAYYTTPRTNTVVLIRREFPNNPPNIVTEMLPFTEDINAELDVQTTDLENDTLLFEITEYPKKLDCDIGNTTGKLKCIPVDDYNGVDFIKVKVTETSLPKFEEALIHEKIITLNVSAVADKTDRYFIDSNGTIFEDPRPSMVRAFIAEANKSSSFSVGKVLLADVDDAEAFSVLAMYTPLSESTFSLTKSNGTEIGIENITSKSFKSLEAYDIGFRYSPNEHGNMSLKFIAKTSDGSFTPSLTVELYILENPCVNGHCGARGILDCDSITRAASFADFMCVCDPGYVGEWCHIEVDECQDEPCDLMYDCEDLINTYECKINVPKLMGILICLLVSGCVSFLIRKIWKNRNKYTISGDAPSMFANFGMNFADSYEIQDIYRRKEDGISSTSQSVFIESVAGNLPSVVDPSSDLTDSGTALFTCDTEMRMTTNQTDQQRDVTSTSDQETTKDDLNSVVPDKSSDILDHSLSQTSCLGLSNSTLE